MVGEARANAGYTSKPNPLQRGRPLRLRPALNNMTAALAEHASRILRLLHTKEGPADGFQSVPSTGPLTAPARSPSSISSRKSPAQPHSRQRPNWQIFCTPIAPYRINCLWDKGAYAKANVVPLIRWKLCRRAHLLPVLPRRRTSLPAAADSPVKDHMPPAAQNRIVYDSFPQQPTRPSPTQCKNYSSVSTEHSPTPGVRWMFKGD